MIKNTFISANLVSLRKISLMIFTSMPDIIEHVFFVNIDDEKPLIVKPSKKISNGEMHIFDIDLPFDFPFGRNVSICTNSIAPVPINLENAVEFPEFDLLFNYDGDDLGALYTKESTKFALWAPLASSVLLELENKDGSFSYHVMTRGDRGVYRLEVKGDLLNRKYHYVVTNSGASKVANDPFGKGTSLNSLYSAVVDYLSIKNRKRIKPKRVILRNTDASIYEVNVRDFTESQYSDVVNKGKYRGFIEKGRKTPKGNPAGLDYLKYMGFSHIQLQPILDFHNPDNPDLNKDYNWGYDPLSFFALEGSYSLHPEIPQERLEEFRDLVDALHENDMRVTIDVVYNHLFEYVKTAFEITVPHYFYRFRPNGFIAQASGCGNDFASEKYMARKAILSSVNYLFDVFDIDGLRFDLMGLLDIDTMEGVYKIAKSYKEDALIYGEGWNMGYELPFEKKACSDNASKLPGIAFFNDSFRDILKGPTFKDAIRQKGFINGDFNYALGFVYAFFGSATDYCYNKRYLTSEQSVNYVECHDNNALFDKLSFSNEGDEKDDLYERVSLANVLTILSFGIPFIHMGQEIGKSKYGLENTYNIPKVNALDYREVDNHMAMVELIRSVLSLRQNELAFLREITKGEDIIKLFDVITEDNLLKLTLKKDAKVSDLYSSVIILVNVFDKPITYKLDDDYHLLLSHGGNISLKSDFNILNGIIAPRSAQVLVKK